MSAVRLRRLGAHNYQVMRGAEVLGEISRTGTLSSGQRWWSTPTVGSFRFPSHRTRDEAVAQLEKLSSSE